MTISHATFISKYFDGDYEVFHDYITDGGLGAELVETGSVALRLEYADGKQCRIVVALTFDEVFGDA